MMEGQGRGSEGTTDIESADRHRLSFGAEVYGFMSLI